MALVDIKKIYIDFCVKDLTVINCTQYDVDSRTFNVNILDNGKPYKIESDKSLSVKMTKKDGTMVLNPCVINDDGTATLLLTEQMCKFDGVYDIQFMYVDNATKEIIHTMPARINIAKSVADNVKIESKDEFKTLNDILLNLKDIESDLKTNEAQRQINEKYRIDNESSRKNNEDIRITSENVRQSNEINRQSQENTRQSQEEGRQTNTATAIKNAVEATKKATEVTNDLQAKLDSHHFVLTEDKGVENGVANLDDSAKVPIIELYEATTTSKGITQLTDSVESTSVTSAATPNSVKIVNDAVMESDSTIITNTDIDEMFE